MYEAGVKVGMIYARLDYRQPLRSVSRFDTTHGFPLFRLNQFALPNAHPVLTHWWIKRFERLYTQYRNEFGRPDLIHVHCWSAGRVARVIARREGIPYLVTEHLSSFLREDLLPQQGRAARQVFDEAAAVVAVSEGLAKQLRKYTDNPRLIVIPNIVDTDFFDIPAQKYSNEVFQLSSIGDPWHTKGYDILLEALHLFKQNTGYPFHLKLGDRIPGRADLLKIIEKYDLSSQVSFLGRLSREKVRAIMQQSDVYISASRWETFGLTMAEAMACGTPVVATKTAGALDVVDQHTGILVPKEDPFALADAVTIIFHKRLIFDAEEIRTYVLHRFGKEVVTEALKKLYTSILEF